MYHIAITNRQSSLRIFRRMLRRVVATVLREESVAEAEISVVIVDDTEMQALNRRHLEHDYPTDVLSFLLDEGTAAETGMRRIEAEIIISAEMAIRRAPDFGWTAEAELTLYLVHGLLHACGYDDMTPHEKQRMRRRERAILRALGVAPPTRARRVRGR